jgi:hypothetical protein
MNKKKRFRKKPDVEGYAPMRLREREEIVYTRDFFRKQGKAGGELGGAAGGRATAEKLSPEERSANARRAVQARWKKHREQKEK